MGSSHLEQFPIRTHRELVVDPLSSSERLSHPCSGGVVTVVVVLLAVYSIKTTHRRLAGTQPRHQRGRERTSTDAKRRGGELVEKMRSETSEMLNHCREWSLLLFIFAIYYPPEVRRGEYWGLRVLLLQYFPLVSRPI